MNLDEVKPKPLGDVPGSPEIIRLKDFRPVSAFNTPVTHVTQARFPVIDMHTHAWQPDTDINAWVNTMEAANVQKAVVLSFETGDAFTTIINRFAAHPGKFDIWCGLDYTGYNQPGNLWTDNAIAKLEHCYKLGAAGVGELGDKGLGEYYSRPVAGYGMHLNDARMQPLLKRCGQLNLPVSVHIADPIWMYLPMDNTNDGMMNAFNWRIDLNRPGLLNHAELIAGFEQAVAQNPGTTFIACHLLNCSHNLSILAGMFNRYTNLYADITSRLKEVATVPRYAKAFIEAYQDRLLYGSDAGYDPGNTIAFAERIYHSTFRLLESADEHIYEHDIYKYHWPLYGLHLSDAVLQKLYYVNATRLTSLS